MAQSTPLLHVTFKDSLLADDKSFFIYNPVNIANTSNQKIIVSYLIEPPIGWKLISQNNQELEIMPNQISSLNIILNRSKTTLAKWTETKLKIYTKNSTDTNFYKFYIKGSIIKNFRARTLLRDILITDSTNLVEFPLKLLNSGNQTEVYHLYYYNYNLGLNEDVKIKLAPGKDTNYLYKLKITSKLKRLINKEDVFLKISLNADKSALYSYVLYRATDTRKIHPSAFSTFPVTFEFGSVVFNKSVSGYFGINAVYDFKNNNKLTVNYNSKQIGIRGIQKDYFNVNYLIKKWEFTIGQINELGLFYSNGNGIKSIYRKNDSTAWGAFLVNSNFIQKMGINAGIWKKYKLGKLTFYHELLSNFNNKTHINSILENNRVNVINTKNKFLDFHLAAGMVHNTFNAVLVNKNMFGYAFGYQFRYSNARWKINSLLNNYSNAFPGVYQGYRNNIQDLRLIVSKKFFVGAIYQSSYFKKIYFFDSVFVHTNLLSNMKQLGVTSGYGFKNISFNLGAGVMTNSIQDNYASPIYKYQSIGTNFSLLKNISFSFNHLIGNQNNFGLTDQNIHMHNTNMMVFGKWFGLLYINTQMPIFNYNYGVQGFSYYQDVKSYSPFLSKNLPKLNLQIKLQYNYTIISPDTSKSKSVAFSTYYMNLKTGLHFQFVGTISHQDYIKNNIALLTIGKPINIPKYHSKQFYQLKLNLFDDVNNNGVQEKNEPSLKNITVYVNNQPYYTNNYGNIKLQNADTGSYNLDFHYAKYNGGLIPSRGFRQNIFLTKNTNIQIPYKTGKTITGSIQVVLDSISHLKFTPDNLKITITDSLGEKYSTLSDEHGNFKVGLPSGMYIVSLNPMAFDDNFKPVQIAISVNLLNSESENVVFQIRQKQRKIIMIKSSK